MDMRTQRSIQIMRLRRTRLVRSTFFACLERGMQQGNVQKKKIGGGERGQVVSYVKYSSIKLFVAVILPMNFILFSSITINTLQYFQTKRVCFYQTPCDMLIKTRGLRDFRSK